MHTTWKMAEAITQVQNQAQYLMLVINSKFKAHYLTL